MRELQYSTSALNVLNRIHRVDAIVYVEGQDDIHFWKNIANAAGINSVRIEEVGGVGALEEKINQIIDNKAKIIVAKDADHDPVLKKRTEHPQIVNTYGYSIENTMYCPCSINNFLSQLSRSLKDYQEIIMDWYEVFSEAVKELLIYDIANHYYERGQKAFGDSCIKFLKNKKSPEISTRKVETYVNELKKNYSDKELAKCKEALQNDDRDLRWLIKGHFITNAILNFIKKIVSEIRGKKISISLEHLYTSTINNCSLCSDHDCQSFSKMAHDLEKAVTSVK